MMTLSDKQPYVKLCSLRRLMDCRDKFMTGRACGSTRLPGNDRIEKCRPPCAGGPYRAFFCSNEGDEPAHIHVRSGEKEAKFWPHDLTVAINAGFPAREIGDIIRHLKQNRDQLVSAWDEYFGA